MNVLVQAFSGHGFHFVPAAVSFVLNFILLGGVVLFFASMGMFALRGRKIPNGLRQVLSKAWMPVLLAGVAIIIGTMIGLYVTTRTMQSTRDPAFESWAQRTYDVRLTDDQVDDLFQDAKNDGGSAEVLTDGRVVEVVLHRSHGLYYLENYSTGDELPLVHG